MDELSSVLREVLRALGMEGDGRIRVPWTGADGPRDPGDRHDAHLAEERSRG